MKLCKPYAICNPISEIKYNNYFLLDIFFNQIISALFGHYKKATIRSKIDTGRQFLSICFIGFFEKMVNLPLIFRKHTKCKNPDVSHDLWCFVKR